MKKGMTKREVEKAVREIRTGLLSVAAAHRNLNMQSERGFNRISDEHGGVRREPNGTMTLTVRINGGARECDYTWR